MPYVGLMAAASNQLNSMRKSYIQKAGLWDFIDLLVEFEFKIKWFTLDEWGSPHNGSGKMTVSQWSRR